VIEVIGIIPDVVTERVLLINEKGDQVINFIGLIRDEEDVVLDEHDEFPQVFVQGSFELIDCTF
jgi:hypothetical protein